MYATTKYWLCVPITQGWEIRIRVPRFVGKVLHEHGASVDLARQLTREFGFKHDPISWREAFRRARQVSS